jgi:hypothetical protein
MRRAAVAVTLLAAACSTPATPPALSASFGEAFTGLYVGQQTQLGRTDVASSSLQVRSSCARNGAAKQGPGEDWICVVQYVDADTPATQSFEVQMKPDGCWKAEGPPTAQPPTLADPVSGRVSVNRLAEFDGCLDTSWG